MCVSTCFKLLSLSGIRFQCSCDSRQVYTRTRPRNVTIVFRQREGLGRPMSLLMGEFELRKLFVQHASWADDGLPYLLQYEIIYSMQRLKWQRDVSHVQSPYIGIRVWYRVLLGRPIFFTIQILRTKWKIPWIYFTDECCQVIFNAL